MENYAYVMFIFKTASERVVWNLVFILPDIIVNKQHITIN